MKVVIRCHIFLLCFALLALHLRAADTNAVDTNALTLVKKILLPNVSGRINHFAADAKGQRLFLAAVDNNTVEVINLAAGKYAGTIGGCSSPRGLAYIPSGNRLVVANGGTGALKILDAASFKVLNTLPDMPEAENIRYDAKSDLIYVAYGNDTLGVIRAAGAEVVTRIQLPGHPESFELEPAANRIFVNVPSIQKVAVIDSAMQAVTEKWWVSDCVDNYPIALDEANHRLFVGCRKPSRLIVLDSSTGNLIGNVDIAKDVNALFYDAARKQIYATCGSGFIDVISQSTPDTYDLREQLPTAKEAHASWFSPERGEFYLAVPGSLISGGAEIRVFKCHP